MAAPLPKPIFETVSTPPGTISPQDSARYTSDQLESLRKVAVTQGQNLLAHLLELARFEAKYLAREGRGASRS